MKTKLLLVLLLVSNITFAQFPTNGLIGEYSFTGGSFVDGANGNNFTQTGTLLTTTDDRFVASNNAINLNGDYLTRPDITFSGTNTFNISYSFWIKTTSNNTNLETIIDDSSRNTTPNFDSDDYGYYIFLVNGKIGLTSRFATRLMFSSPILPQGYSQVSTKFIADGDWHHIVIEFRAYITSGIQSVTSKIYVDTIAESKAVNHNGIIISPNTTGNATIANSRTNHLTSVNQYKDVIDDLLIYNRVLTPAEVTGIGNYNGYCFSPASSILSTSSITNTEATINISDTGTYDIAYHKSSEPFSSAIISTGVSSGSITIMGLEEFVTYELYIREQCGANITAWSLSTSFTTTRTIGRIYIDGTATGNNNGVSWNNAYTNLENALTNISDNEEIWMADGIYKPHASDKTIYFEITENGTKIYGGFDGTETQLSQRDFRTNETILSGDLLGNDNANISLTEPTRSDNASKIIFANANDFTLDGVTVSGGVGFDAGNSFYDSGAALTKEPSKNNLTIDNCIFKDNVTYAAGAAIFARYGVGSTGGFFTILNSTFSNNVARLGTSFYSYTDPGVTIDIDVKNSLFNDNTATNIAGAGFAGSAGWVRAFGLSSTITASFVNNTYTNNRDAGTGASLNNFTRATLGISQDSGTMNANVDNCIFWNNKTGTGNAIARSITGIHVTLGNVTVANSIDENNFSIIPAGNTTNTSNADPLFTNATNDFTLQTGSPAIDTGNNVAASGISEDLLGNQRVWNTTVDMGVYEFGSTLGIDDNIVIDDFTLYPNPTKSILNIKMNAIFEKAEVYSLQGQRLLISSTKTIDVTNLSSGIYIVNVITASGSSVVKRFIKQ